MLHLSLSVGSVLFPSEGSHRLEDLAFVRSVLSLDPLTVLSDAGHFLLALLVQVAIYGCYVVHRCCEGT